MDKLRWHKANGTEISKRDLSKMIKEVIKAKGNVTSGNIMLVYHSDYPKHIRVFKCKIESIGEYYPPETKKERKFKRKKENGYI